MSEQTEQHRFRDAMQLTASGVAIITTDGPAGRTGITVSTFQSFSMDPPSVMVCVYSDSRHLAKIRENGVFVANALASGQRGPARIFAGASQQQRDDFFATGGWRALSTGAPVLGGSLASFDCRIGESFAYASHTILIGLVQAIAIEHADPLVYSGRAYRRLRAFGDEQLQLKGELIAPF